MKAILALEDGSIFHGESFAGQGEIIAPLVFNSYMIGYQGAVTDPANLGRMLCFTYPLIGSYGINDEDSLSEKVQASAVIVREYVARPRNYRATSTLAELLEKNKVLGVQGMDTRAITRRISKNGPMKAVLSTVDFDPASLMAKTAQVKEEDWVERVSAKHIYSFKTRPSDISLPLVWQGGGRFKVAVLDLGVRTSLLNRLLEQDFDLMILPAGTTSRQIMDIKPHGLIVSGGPGSPQALNYVVNTLRELTGRLPMWGIGLGCLVLAEAHGAQTINAIPGYFAGSQPVKEVAGGHAGISDQNLTYTIKPDTLPADIKVSYQNQIDGSIAGFVHSKLPVMGVAFNPESSGAPLGDNALFAEFTRMLDAQ